jgi:hypothetical protein
MPSSEEAIDEPAQLQSFDLADAWDFGFEGVVDAFGS